MKDKQKETIDSPPELAGEEEQNSAAGLSAEGRGSEGPGSDSLSSDVEGAAETAPELAPELTSEEIENLKQKASERDSFLEELRRAKADLDNYQKRVRRERPTWEEQAVGRFIRELLPVVDSFERALESMNADSDESSVGEGVRLIHQMLRQVLAESGVEEISAQNEQFDPEWHEAMVQEEVEDRPTGEVVDVLEKGYRYGSLILRPSKVKVALNVKASAEDGGETSES